MTSPGRSSRRFRCSPSSPHPRLMLSSRILVKSALRLSTSHTTRTTITTPPSFVYSAQRTFTMSPHIKELVNKVLPGHHDKATDATPAASGAASPAPSSTVPEGEVRLK